MTVAALIVTYQHARYVGEAIRSVLEQTRPVDEIVVVDDGSEDGTVGIVETLAGHRATIVRLPHRGVSALAETYNAGLARCHSDTIALLEGDDRWPRDKLRRQVGVFDDVRVAAAHGAYAVIGAHGTLLGSAVRPGVRLDPGLYDATPLLLRASFIMPVTSVVRRSALEQIGGFRQLGSTPHIDHPTFLALSRVGPFHYTDAVVGEWRRHGQSVVYRSSGADMEGADISLQLSIDMRRELSGFGGGALPSVAEITRSWGEAFAHQAWQASRALLLQKRYGHARRVALDGLRRASSLSLRVRLAAAAAAAIVRVDIERLAPLLRRRSAFSELE